MLGGLMLPVFTVLSALWFSAAAILLLAGWWATQQPDLPLWRHHQLAETVAGIPGWLFILVVLCGYALVALPIGAARRAALHYANGGRLHGWADVWSGLLWLTIVALALAAAWQLLPHLAWGWSSPTFTV